MVEAEPGVVRLDAEYCSGLLPRRDPGGHKGTFGTLVCVCGSLEYAGAALLCASSAVRGGAGLVALAVPRSLQPVVAGRVPEVVTLALPEAGEPADIDPASAGHAIKARSPDALVIGPGLPETEGYRELILGLLVREGSPMVIDGGALNLLSSSGDWWTAAVREAVLTPHPGEFARLTGSAVGASEDERAERAIQAARRFNQVVVLKGAHTVIGAPDGRLAVAPFANAALATAGSGDVLSGLIGAFLAQGVGPFDAACLGVYLHGRAGERLAWRFGDAGIAASDLPYEIALARHELSAHSG
jgi:NAD(P)H-hydrate epimerase